MKKIIKLSLLILFLTLLVTQWSNITNIFLPKTAFAVGDLTVNWGVPEGNPIFTLSNFAPGSSESRTVNITNGAASPRPVGIRGIQTSDPGNLASVLTIVIKKNGTDIYGGTSPTGAKTVSQFFTDSTLPDFVSLTTLNPAASATYSITVTFQTSAGNPFQNKTLIFDLKIGINIAAPLACSDMVFGNVIFGTQRGDKLNGTSGNDLIFGLEGGDLIDGKGGDDCIVGGAGGDSLNGNTGNDKVFGEGGGDLVQGGVGNDYLEGNDGSDSLSGGNNNDTLLGGNGSDNANGNSGIDTCVAESRTNCEL